MRLPLLQCLLLDCTGARAKDWFYNVGCLVSSMAVASTAVALLTFGLDYYHLEPVYHSLPHAWHAVLYTACLACALLTALPPLVLALMAIRGVHFERHSVAARLSGLARFDNFYCHGSLTRYLFVSTVCAAGTILFNTVSVGILSLGVGSLFGRLGNTTTGVDSLQCHFDCCGLRGFADWAALAPGRVPVSCRVANASLGLPAVRAALRHQRQLPGYNSTTVYVPIHSGGCASALTSEQAVTCSIANMLTFAGVLLLVAAWTRAERVAEISARDLKSKNFSDPRLGEEAAEFLERRRVRRHRQARDVISSLSSTTSPSQSSSTRSTSDVTDVSSAVHSKQMLMSDGFLVSTDSDTSQSRNSLGSNSEGSEGGNENNSALDLSGPWRAARVVNSLTREMLLWGMQLQQQQHQHQPHAVGDSVRLEDETQSPKELDARGLLCYGAGARSLAGDPSPSPRRRARPAPVIRSREPPLLLDTLLANGESRRRRVTFQTSASGRFPLDCDS